MKKLLKSINRWYDKQEGQLRFILMLIIVIPGIIVTQAFSFFGGMAYLLVLLVIRWMHINGKLNG